MLNFSTLPNYIRYTIFFLPFALLLAALGYIDWSSDSKTNSDQNMATQTIDFFVTNSESIQFNEEGHLRYVLLAKKLDHILETDISYVDRPNMSLYRKTSDIPWHIISDKGEVSPAGKEVELIDNVRISRMDELQRNSVLTTQRLTYIPDENIAKTKESVRMETNLDTTTAIGMEAFINDGKVNLLSNVRGEHEVR
ncbi:LPS export ABC transporter periplasmic protein LptC [Pseudomonas sp. F1_0610]|uniref:LPS export ABC transporter periplasmic protein LptC n=1 Tax=Pseudomonas sp. F1_0610 TaxID=3114284 RepID=UPI0039C03E10